MKVYKYKWTKKYRADPQVAGAIFQKLKDDDAVLEEAANARSPLHADFDWDDTSAAHAHRLHQVRTMRCSLQIEVITKSRKSEHINAFVLRVGKPGFVPVMEATPTELSQAEKVCWRAAVKFRQRFKGLQFAREIVEAIADQERSGNRVGEIGRASCRERV